MRGESRFVLRTEMIETGHEHSPFLSKSLTVLQHFNRGTGGAFWF